MIIGHTIHQVGVYIQPEELNKFNCLLLAFRDLLQMNINTKWQIDIISKHKCFNHLRNRDVSLTKIPRSQELP